MALLNLTAASRTVGVNRSTIARAIKSGRLSASTDDAGERCIDTAELLRVFGPLKDTAYADAHPLPMHAPGSDALLVEVLREQLRYAQDREQQAQAEKVRLLTLLEVEQQTRRELEVKLLPAPSPKPRGNPRLFLWIILLLASVALLAAWVWPEWLTWGVENIMRRYISN
jgi:cytochrome c-type biogenesis protein CcmH/NrfG